MANIGFLTRSKASTLVPVYLRFSDMGGKDMWIQTPFRMIPEYWNNKTQAFRQRILYSDVFM